VVWIYSLGSLQNGSRVRGLGGWSAPKSENKKKKKSQKHIKGTKTKKFVVCGQERVGFLERGLTTSKHEKDDRNELRKKKQKGMLGEQKNKKTKKG